MRQVTEYFYTTPPATLYHYTGVGALLGMAESRSVWASHIYYLNDSQEILYACKVLDDVLGPRLAFGEQASTEIHFLRQLQAWLNSFRVEHYSIFVFSLSEEQSLLSQWRSYTPHGKGVSLGLSSNIVASIARDSQSVIAKCVYERDAQHAILRSFIEKLLITFNQKQKSIDVASAPPKQEYFKFLEGFRNEFLQVLSVIKHPAFSEEKEWRIISPYFARYTVPEIKFREGSSMLIPYLNLAFPQSGEPFESVTLGPSQNQNMSMSALAMFLNNKCLCSRTENSTVPYREW
jgi:hypothetical protein